MSDFPPTLVEASRRIEAGEQSSLELIEGLIERISKLDGTLHAIVAIDVEAARKAAQAADTERRAGRSRGPLHGLPIGLKDICATAKLPTTVGSVALSPFMSGKDCDVAARLGGAGALVFAKLATTEAAFMDHHESVVPPLNPWHPDYWTGVSSSGSGVATAAGLCLGSFGTDTGGSIRFPALCCGLVGVKATWGRVSRHGVFPLAPSLDHIGPMTRCVHDAALLLEAVAGFDPKDPTSLAAPVPSYSKEIEKGVAGLRVGYDERYCENGVAGEISRAIRDALSILEEAGAEVVRVELPDTRDAVSAFPTLVTTEAALSHAQTPTDRAAHYSPSLAEAIAAGASTPATEYAAAHQARLEFSGALNRLFETVDVYLAPAWGRTTPTLSGYADSSDAELAALIQFTAPENLAGVPTVTVPGGRDDAGVPFGFQIVGPRLGEAAALRAAAAYEKAADFTSWRPPL